MQELCRYREVCLALFALFVSAAGCERRVQETAALVRDETRETERADDVHETDAPNRGEGSEPARADDRGSKAERPSGREGSLQLRISTPKTTIVQCEPLPVKFELKNTSDQVLKVSHSLGFGFGFLLVDVTPPGEKRYRIEPIGIVFGDGMPREIRPQQSVTHGRLLHHNWDQGFHFKRPGQYHVDATFEDLPMRVHSNTLVLTVIEAQGDDAKTLEERWGCHPVGQSVTGVSDGVITREFEAILRKYPNSVYAPWCELALTLSAHKRARQDREMRTKFGAEVFPRLTEDAIRDYERFLKKYPDFPFPFSVSMPYTVAKMKLHLGRRDEASAEIGALINKHPEVDFIKEAAFRMKSDKERGTEFNESDLP